MGFGSPLPRAPAWLLPALLALAGCTPVGAAVGGAAVVGTTAAEERSMGAAVDDAVIATNVSHQLFQKSLDLFGDVAVEVFEGRVLLTGDVPTPEDRVEAVRLAWQVKGVKEVLNEIQVSDRSGIANYARDVWISTQIRSKLLLDREILSLNYNVETVNGVVYMIGIAQSPEELERATNHARTIKYVRKVVSHVRLKEAATAG